MESESVVKGKGKSQTDDADSEANSFDKRDDMTEDERIALGGKEANLVTIGGSEDDIICVDEESDEGNKRGKKRCKVKGAKIKVKVEGGSKATSNVWGVFEKMTVPSPSEKGKISKAKCNYCNKLYAYTQGGATSPLLRHINLCKSYLKSLEKKLDQTLLNYAPSKEEGDEEEENIENISFSKSMVESN